MILEMSLIGSMLAAIKAKREKEIENLPLDNKENIKRYIYHETKKAGLNPIIAVRQAIQESALNPRAVSPAGAKGVLQFMPGTWAMYGKGDIFNVKNQVAAYIKYMKKLRRDFPNRIDLQLAGYNWGENRKTLRDARDNNIGFYGYKDKLPAETRNYVQKIFFN